MVRRGFHGVARLGVSMAVSGQVQHGYAWHGFQGTVCKGEAGCGEMRLGMGFKVRQSRARHGWVRLGMGFAVWLVLARQDAVR
jgi:hypothetical protein